MIHLREIPGWPRYFISEEGSVWSSKRNIWMRLSRDKDGYLQVSLWSGVSYKKLKVHRLVALAWIGVPEDLSLRVLHRDDNKDNNHYLNLKWGTDLENGADKVVNGRAACGEANGNCLYSDAQVTELRALVLSGLSRAEACRRTGMPYGYSGRLTRNEFRRSLLEATQ